ncbi:MAG: hypothetical protein OQJ89_05650 [Kangiellaceae bacterium]|nr:hypothetical protein [Kangiellaceae bacterium]MCW8999408.1 hypothetical protein [Kangiellaceae bacterium]MCW9016427.1 hypothetical protein [Kangiellaceae bacterium]
MKTSDILRELQKRVPWSIMRTYLKSNEILTGQGWDATIGQILEFVDNKPAEEERILRALNSYFESHVLYGEKAVSFYKIDTTHLNSLISNLGQYHPIQGHFTDSYPIPLNESKLKEIKGLSEVVKVNKVQNNFEIVICSSRSYQAAVQLELSDLTRDAIEEHSLQGFTEIVAKKDLIKQFYDVVSIDANSGIMELRLDYGHGVSLRDFLKSLKATQEVFFNLCNQLIGSEIEISGPINLFPLVDKLYNDARDARVCELGFTTNSGSVKLERMRRKPIDLRVEAYHKGGKAAVNGKLSPYRIALSWTMRKDEIDENHPEILLAGRLKCLSSPDEHLKNAIFSKILDKRDYAFLSGEIVKYINELELE